MLVSIVLFTVLSILGIVYTLLKALITLDSTRVKLMYNEAISQVKYSLINIAITADEYGNVYCGELLEYLCTYNRNTLFIHADVTISASLGFVESHCKMTPFGLALKNLLNKVFDDNHCMDSYIYLLKYKEAAEYNEFKKWLEL